MNRHILTQVLTSTPSLSALILRIPTGIIFMAHGSQKLFGLFGGYGLEGTGQWMASMGIEPGYLMALLAGSGEFFGGLALLLGLFTRPAAAVTGFTMIIAIFSVHIHNGLFLQNNGYEYALALLVICIALICQGSGKVAIDQWIVSRLNSNNHEN